MLLILTSKIYFNYSKLEYNLLIDTFVVQYMFKIKFNNKGIKFKY